MPVRRGKFGIEFRGIAELTRQLARDGEVWQRVHQAAGRGMGEDGAGDAVVGEVGFNTPYALAQHERLDFNHPKGGKAKYLEENLKDHGARYQDNLADHLRGA